MSKLKLRPLGDRVWVEPIEQEETTASGIVLPETAKEKPMEGKVLAVGPGNRNDWLAVFDASAPRDSRDALAWGYVKARSSGALSLGATTAESGWPLPAGRYVVRLLEDDGFALLAESSPFAVE